MVVGIGTEGTLKTLAQLCSCLLSCTDFVDSWISNQSSCAVASTSYKDFAMHILFVSTMLWNAYFSH